MVFLNACAEFGDVFTADPQSSSHAIRRETVIKQERTLSSVDKTAVSEPEEQSSFIWPVEGRFTSPFGRRRGRDHDGIDIVAPRGTPIHAASSGRVLYTGRIRGYGNLIILKHAGNYFTAYGHLSQIKVSKGQKVVQGMLIGNVGRTGRASSPHLHFEIRRKMKAQDPIALLPPR